MSFAEELRKTHKTKKQNTSLQYEKEWNHIINSIYEHIKIECTYAAESGRNSHIYYLNSSIEFFENEYTSKVHSFGTHYGYVYEIEFENNEDAQC